MNQPLTKVLRLKKILPRLTLAALLTAAYSTATLGDDIKVKLSGDQEVPPVTTQASGSGTIVIGTDKSVSGGVTTTGIQGTAARTNRYRPSWREGPPPDRWSQVCPHEHALAPSSPTLSIKATKPASCT